MKISFSNVVGAIIVIAVLSAVVSFIRRVNEMDDPCWPYNVEQRQKFIESHERCMTEANCIYEDWDIRKYDDRLEMQKRCEANRNEQ